MAAAPGTVFSSNGYYTIEDVTTATSCSLYTWATSNSGATVTLTIGCTLAAGHTVLVTASEVSNPATTSTGDAVTVSTSSDTLSAQTNSYAITAAKAVTSPSVILSTTTAGATNVTYSTSFTTSSTGGLAPTYSTITLNAPAGTDFGTNGTYTIEDVTTGAQCGAYSAGTSNGGATVTLTDNGGCGTIAGGHSVLVTATGVSNPTTAATGESLTVTTSSDTLSAQTNSYAITAAKAVTSPSVALTTKAAGATNVTYDVRFTTSSTGALAPYYSTITLNAPAGTVFGASGNYAVFDVTTGTNCGYYNPVVSNGGTTVTLGSGNSCGTIAGGDTVQVTDHGCLEPAVNLDWQRRDGVHLLGPPLGPDQHVRHHGGPGAGVAVDHPLHNGGRSDQRHLHGLVHHVLDGVAGALLLDDHARRPGGNRLQLERLHDRRPHDRGAVRATTDAVTSNSGATLTVSPYTGCGTIAGGDTVLVTASNVTNPATATTGEAVTVSTSSDITPVQTNSYAITAAKAVSSPSVALSTTAAGATNVTYDVRFTASSTGSLAPYYSTITLAAPAGTNFGPSTSYTIEDLTTATQCGYYTSGTSNGGATVTLSDGGSCGTIASGDTVLVTATGVANPATASTGDVITVSTSSDTVSANTNTYAIGGGAQAVASPLVTLSSAAAGATNVTYTTTFSTSSTGSLAADAGTITLAAPAGTELQPELLHDHGSHDGNVVRVLQRGHQQRRGDGDPDGRLRHRGLQHGAGHGERGRQPDGDLVGQLPQRCFDLLGHDGRPHQHLRHHGGPSGDLAVGCPLDDGRRSDQRHLRRPLHHLVDGSAGALLVGDHAGRAGGDELRLDRELLCGPGSHDGTNCGYYTAITSNGGATISLTEGCGIIAAGDTVQVTLSAASNPATTSTGDVVTVSTSSDTTAAHTNSYAITAGQAVASPSVTLSTTAAGATNVTYSTSFTTSATGRLAPYYSTITLSAPTGTVFGSTSSYTIADVTTGTDCGYSNVVTSNGGATVTLTGSSGCGIIAGGDVVLVTATGVSNPTTTSTGDVVTVSTSSDTTAVHSNTYAITAAKAVTSPSVALSTTAAGATNVTYDVRFTTSSTGALAPYYSTITLAAPAGTNFGSSTTYTIEDLTTGANCGYYNAVTSNGGATVALSTYDSCGTIAGGDTVLVTASQVSNPTTTSTGDVVTVSTSSDPVAAQTSTYAITAAQAVTSPSVALSTTAAGATNVTYDVRFTTSSTGALAPYYSTITLAAPMGTTFTSSATYTVEDLTTGSQCGDYNPVTSNGGATVTLGSGGSCGTIAGGDTVLVTASQVANPATTSTGDVVTVSTSSDTTAAHTNTYAITAGSAVSSPSVTLSTTAAGATNVTYTASFTTSPTGALAPYYSTITVAAPAGTDFTSSSFTIEDITTATSVRVLHLGLEQRWSDGHLEPLRLLRHHRRRRHGAGHGHRRLQPGDGLDG